MEDNFEGGELSTIFYFLFFSIFYCRYFLIFFTAVPFGLFDINFFPSLFFKFSSQCIPLI